MKTIFLVFGILGLFLVIRALFRGMASIMSTPDDK